MKKTEDAITERMVSAIKFQKRSRYEHEKKKEKQKSGGCPAIRFESTTLTIERIKEAPAIKRFEFIPLCRACHSRFALLSSWPNHFVSTDNKWSYDLWSIYRERSNKISLIDLTDTFF